MYLVARAVNGLTKTDFLVAFQCLILIEIKN